MMMNLMTILVKKVFISSKPTFVYLLCPPLCGPFSIQESAAGGLSYKVKKTVNFSHSATSQRSAFRYSVFVFSSTNMNLSLLFINEYWLAAIINFKCITSSSYINTSYFRMNIRNNISVIITYCIDGKHRMIA